MINLRQNKKPLFISLILLFLPKTISITPLHGQNYQPPPPSSFLTIPRGGSSSPATTNPKNNKNNPLQNYLIEQHHLHTLRATILSEYLAHRRSLPLHTLQSIQTPESAKPPRETDWDCAISTPSDPKSCLYSFEAPAGTKVLAPAGSEMWISLSALNRLRRTDPSKVQPMWHDKYAILDSWFRDGEYSVLAHAGWEGFVVSHVLLDHPIVLRAVIRVGFLACLWMTLPVWDYFLNRMLVSGLLWKYYRSWGRFVHAAFPLKLLVGQMVWKFVAGQFDALESMVRGVIVDIECGLLEERIPVTVGGEEEELVEENDGSDDESNDDSDEW